jgi:flagellar hook protein FlgE
MDVIGNNIANANTTGFKSSTANFSDAFYQEYSSASSSVPVGTAVGLGVDVTSTTTNFTQGSFQSTGVQTDLSINGSGLVNGGGFFVICNTTDSSTSGSAVSFTRAGDFTLDSSGYLVTQDGSYVMGSATAIASTGTDLNTLTAIQIPSTITSTGELVSSFNVASDGTVTAVGESGTTEVVAYLGVAVFSNPNALTNLGNNLYSYNAGAGTSTGCVITPGTGAAGSIKQGSLELSNVDLSTEFANMIVTQRAFEANSKTISASSDMMQTVTNMIR